MITVEGYFGPVKCTSPNTTTLQLATKELKCFAGWKWPGYNLVEGHAEIALNNSQNMLYTEWKWMKVNVEQVKQTLKVVYVQNFTDLIVAEAGVSYRFMYTIEEGSNLTSKLVENCLGVDGSDQAAPIEHSFSELGMYG